MSGLHEAWELIPLEGELSLVSATDIKRLTGEEPRLMTKWDHSARLPPALKRAGKFILPIKNGHYAVLTGVGYHAPEPCPPPINHPRQHTFELVTSREGTSESQYLDLAYNSGLFSHFLDEPLLYPTIRGRKYSPSFELRVGAHNLSVASVQLEVDIGYEGPDCIVLVEAKIGECEDFHLRQLYYPYRSWLSLSSKRVRPVFFTYEPATAIYRFREYAFDPPEVYQTPRLVKATAYRLVDPLPETGPRGPVRATVPIPQADKISRIAQVPLLVALGYNTARTLAERLEFDPRQGSYYLDAACSVGLLQKGPPYRLSPPGEQYVAATPAERQATLSRAILGVPLIQELLISLLTSPQGQLGRAQLLAIMRRSTGLKDSTAERRTQTLWAWLSWVAEQGGNFVVSKDEIRLVGAARTAPQTGQLPLF